MDLSLFGQSRDAERRHPAAHPVLAPGSPTPRERGPTRRSTQLNTLSWLPQSGASEDGHFLSLRRTQTPQSRARKKPESSRFPECHEIVCTLFFTHSKVGRAKILTRLRLRPTSL